MASANLPTVLEMSNFQKQMPKHFNHLDMTNTPEFSKTNKQQQKALYNVKLNEKNCQVLTKFFKMSKERKLWLWLNALLHHPVLHMVKESQGGEELGHLRPVSSPTC
jgi:hypothetical protein